MLRVWLNLTMVLALVACLAACPYSCLEHPRCAGAARVAAAADGCGCGCHSASEPATPGEPADDSQPGPKQPCSCACVCKGALRQSPGQTAGDGPASANWVPIGLVPTTLPEPAPLAIRADRSELSPPKVKSGREIRALIASLLL